MEKTTPRRSFLLNTIKAGAGMALLTSTNTLFAGSSGASSPFQGYRPFSEAKTDLRQEFIGKNVAVAGRIFNSSGKRPLVNVKVEVWHLSPQSGKYRHRAQFYTDAAGNYSFITDMPGRELGKYHKIYFKLSQGERTAFTELSFNSWGAHISDKHWEANQGLDHALLFPTSETFLDTQQIQFNITL